MKMATLLGTWLSGGVAALLLLLGIFLTLRSGIYPVRGLPFILRGTIGTLLKKEDPARCGISPFQAVSTALAGTMGVGNIAGVATALAAGGPGAIFWMWVGAFFGMATKYAEIFLAVKYRQKDSEGRWYGGPMYYMEHGAGSRKLAGVFAVLCALSALGIGNMTQANSVASAMENAFSIPAAVSGGVMTAVVAMVIFGGIRRIAAVTETVIPFISILYLCCAGAFLFLRRDSVGGAFELIFREAFRLRPAISGAAGFGIIRAARFGLSRGVFTHEAGLGSAPIAHAAADCKSPAHQGVWGIFEVFLDTIVVCTVTALVILTAGNGLLWQSGLNGAPLTSEAFASAFGGFGNGLVAGSVVFYAISAMLGWCYYGESALRYLMGGSRLTANLYRAVFLACVLIGATWNLTSVWAVSDVMNALMALSNIAALILLRGQLRWPADPDRRSR